MSDRPEPLLNTATITALGSALVALLVAFGLPLNDTQETAIIGLVSVVAPLVVALVARSKVTPVTDPRTESGAPLVPRDAGEGIVGVLLTVVIVLALIWLIVVLAQAIF